MSDTLAFDIVTPDGTLFSDQVEMITLPAIDGQIRVLPHQVRLTTQIVPGEITVRKAGSATYFAVGGGLVEVGSDRVTIVTDMAVEVAWIDEAKIEETRQRAEARLRDKISKEEIASVNAPLACSLAPLRVKRRHRG